MDRIEVVIPAGLDSWAPARLADGGGDVLHLTPAEAMQLVEALLDAVHDAAPGLCCGEPRAAVGDEPGGAGDANPAADSSHPRPVVQNRRGKQPRAAHLAVLLDALDGVQVTHDERSTLKRLADGEPRTVENVAALFAKARATLVDGMEWYPHEPGLAWV